MNSQTKKPNRDKGYIKKWPRKTLSEVLNFLEMVHPEGLNIRILAQELGMTPGSVSNLFRRDNMKLSKVEKIAEAYGYQVRLLFPTKTYPEGITPPKHGKTFKNAGKLTGLAMYIYDSNRNIHFVSREMKMYSTMLNNAFSSGDILLTNLYKVTDHLGIVFLWRFEKIKQNA